MTGSCYESLDNSEPSAILFKGDISPNALLTFILLINIQLDVGKVPGTADSKEVTGISQDFNHSLWHLPQTKGTSFPGTIFSKIY